MQIYFLALLSKDPGDDLENILNEIHTSREELCIAAIKKKIVEYEEYEEKPELTTVPERPLRLH